MRKLNPIAILGFLSLNCVFLNVTYGEALLPTLKVESRVPLSLSVFDQGPSYDLSLPGVFIREVEDLYDEVHIEDLTGDGVGEVIFHLEGGGVNSCSRVLHYSSGDRSLSELVFGGGGLCNFKIWNGSVVSSYKDGAAWVDDVYIVKSGRADLKISDRCVGCGEISRKEYRPDGTFIRSLVSDDINFDQRSVLTAKVASLKAWIFPSSGATQSTKKYLIRGDEITLLGVDKTREEGWVEFRFSGKTITEGWLICSDIGGCKEF